MSHCVWIAKTEDAASASRTGGGVIGSVVVGEWVPFGIKLGRDLLGLCVSE
jgi:hypothetical protein